MKKKNPAYRQIHVVLHNAKLTANSNWKREQKFLVFSELEAIQKRHELSKSDSFGSDSRISFIDANSKEEVKL
jgi:hypothetical protein